MRTLGLALVCAMCLAGAPEAAGARPKARVTLAAPARAPTASPLVVTGRVTKLGRRTAITLEQLKGRRWVRRGVTKVKRADGGFRLKWRRPGKKSGGRSLRVSARRGSTTVRSRRVRVRFSSNPALKTTAPVLTPRAKSVTAAPTAGAAGAVRLSEPIEAARGDVLALGIGPKTPYGLLAKVTRVKHRANGSTVLSTKPVALIDVLPTGSIDTKLPSGSATNARKPRPAVARTAAAVPCTNGRSLKLTATTELSQSLDFEAEWERLRVVSAELTANVRISASVAVSADGSVSCTLAPQEILKKTFAPVAVPGPLFPIVLVPRAHVAVSGGGSVEGRVAAEMKGSLTASAGLGYSASRAYRIGDVTPAFSSQPPTADFRGQLAASLSPSLEVLVYGVAGPELAFKAGADLDVTGVSPACYLLGAHISLVGRLNIPALNLSSPDLPIWRGGQLLAQAPTAPRRCGESPPPPPTPPPPPAPPGLSTLDPTFSTDGRQTTNFGGNSEAANAVAVRPDGKVVVAGTANDGPTNASSTVLARYNADGTLDSSFSGDGKLPTDTANSSDGRAAMALQPDGKVVVAGYSPGTAGSDFAVDRYDAGGTLDDSFSDDGTQQTDFSGDGSEVGSAVAVQPDGKIVVAGSFLSEGTAGYDFALARYNADGTLDSSFSGDGKQTTDFAGLDDFALDGGIALGPNGTIVVLGSAEDAMGNHRALARYTANGALDSSFSADGRQMIGASISAVAVQADGKIVGTGGEEIVRFNAGGALDSSFSGDGRQTIDFGDGFDTAGAVALRSDGRIVIAGNSVHNPGASAVGDFGLARYTAAGALDPSFSGDGRETTDFSGSRRDAGRAVALEANGRIVVAGATGTELDDDLAIARYTGGS